MLLAKEILDKARFTLSDAKKERWTDKRLLSLLNDGLDLLSKRTTLFEEHKIVILNNLVTDLNFSEVATKITRAEYQGKPVEFLTFEELDHRVGKDWQSHKGDRLKALIYNKQKPTNLITYPALENQQSQNISYNTLYGIVTDISYSEIQPYFTDTFGDIQDIPDNALLKIFYMRKPEKVLDINQQIIIDTQCDVPLAHFIASFCLRDNSDTENRNKASEELQLFEAFVEIYNVEKSKNYNRTNRESAYRPLG